MSLPYLPPYYFTTATEQLRSCLAAINTPTSSSASSNFSIDSLLGSRGSLQMPFPQMSLPTDIFHWPSAATYPFLQSTLVPSPLFNPFLPSFLGGKRKRRHRTIFSEEQLQILETTFSTTHYPDVALREKLAIQCELKEERVEVWFKNRRAKERKQKREGGKEIKMSASDESEYEVSDEDESKPKKTKTSSGKVEKSSPEKETLDNACIKCVPKMETPEKRNLSLQ